MISSLKMNVISGLTLHLRPIGKIVSCVSGATIFIVKDNKKANANSVSDLLSLDIKEGENVSILFLRKKDEGIVKSISDIIRQPVTALRQPQG